MSDQLRFLCSACGKKYKAPASAEGKSLKCTCGQPLVVKADDRLIVDSSKAVAERVVENASKPQMNAPNDAPRWSLDKSNQTIRIWCEQDRSEVTTRENGDLVISYSETDIQNMKRQALGTATHHSFLSGKVEVSFPSQAGRHIVKVACPLCQEEVPVLVKVDDNASRKRFLIEWFPVAILVTLALWALFAWLAWQETDWGNLIGLGVMALIVGLLPVGFLYGIAVQNGENYFSAEIANLLPSRQQMNQEDREKIYHHAIGCVEPDKPQLTWNESHEAWLKS